MTQFIVKTRRIGGLQGFLISALAKLAKTTKSCAKKDSVYADEIYTTLVNKRQPITTTLKGETMTENIRNSSLRKLVEQRDKGICDSCGCDTDLARAVLDHTLRHLREIVGFRAFVQWRKLVEMTGFRADRQTWWDADHIRPLSEGGADDLDNLRTLCLPCHRRETSRLCKRIAKIARLQQNFPRQKYQRDQLYQLGD